MTQDSQRPQGGTVVLAEDKLRAKKAVFKDKCKGQEEMETEKGQ